MDFKDKKYVIGIDLGTTNSAVSFIKDREKSGNKIEKKDAIKVFQVPQLTGQGEFSKVSVLPSFLYIPGEYDISKESLKHSWKKSHDSFAGVFVLRVSLKENRVIDLRILFLGDNSVHYTRIATDLVLPHFLWS